MSNTHILFKRYNTKHFRANFLLINIISALSISGVSQSVAQDLPPANTSMEQNSSNSQAPAAGNIGAAGATGANNTELQTPQITLQDKTTIDYRSAPLLDVIRHIAEVTKINVSIAPEVEAKGNTNITIRLTDVNYETALNTILQLNNLGTVMENGILRIDLIDNIKRQQKELEDLKKEAQRREPAKTLILQLNYGSSDDVATLLKSSLKQYDFLNDKDVGKFQITSDKRSNKIMIYSIQEVQSKVKAIIENLDKPEPQVVIDARIVEASSEVSKVLDIQWGGNFGGAYAGLNTGLLFPSSILGSIGGAGIPGASGDSTSATTGAGATAVLTPDIGTLGLSFGSLNGILNLNAVLKAFESESLLNVVASPTMTVTNNERATFEEQIETTLFTTSGGVANKDTKNATISLDVKPKIGSDNLVNLDVKVTRDMAPISEMKGANGSSSVTKRTAHTIMTLKGGETGVIGGLYQTSRTKTLAKVPFFSKIPIIGALFRKDQDFSSRKEIMILITPRIVIPDGSQTGSSAQTDFSSLPTSQMLNSTPKSEFAKETHDRSPVATGLDAPVAPEAGAALEAAPAAPAGGNTFGEELGTTDIPPPDNGGKEMAPPPAGEHGNNANLGEL